MYIFIKVSSIKHFHFREICLLFNKYIYGNKDINIERSTKLYYHAAPSHLYMIYDHWSYVSNKPCDKHTKTSGNSYLADQVADLPPWYGHLMAKSGTNLGRLGGRSGGRSPHCRSAFPQIPTLRAEIYSRAHSAPADHLTLHL